MSLWGIDYSHEVGVVSRRGAALFFGIGVMLFLARHAEPSPSRAALSYGFSVGCLALASLGLFEMAKKRAGIGIISAILVEIALAVAFLIADSPLATLAGIG